MAAKAPKPDLRAPVGLAMIAKDAEKTLGRCLDSIRPFVSYIVVGVDTRSQDKTAKVARKHGADLVFPAKVSDWHECPQHGKVLAQHFADARNETFSKLPRELEWALWLDADDVFVGGEKLKAILASTPPQVNCVWAPYRYATVNDGAAVTTVFDRERFLRWNIPWVWKHRVHETVEPVGQPLQPTKVPADVYVWHQEGVHKTEASTTRNHLLLEIDLEENPDDTRTIFYMANGLFAQQRWADCIPWYLRCAQDDRANPFERWQSYCYCSLAYERVGDLDGATEAAYAAIDILPEYKEPYYRLASVYLLAGEPAKTVYWTGVADEKAEPPYFVFKNPVDYTYNSRTALADAYYRMGDVRGAYDALTEAKRVITNPVVEEAHRHYAGLLRAAEQANGYVVMAQFLDDAGKVRLYEQLPEDVKAFGRCRDVAVPAMMRLRQERLTAA